LGDKPFSYDVEYLDLETISIGIELNLTEAIEVIETTTGYNIRSLPEPDLPTDEFDFPNQTPNLTELVPDAEE
jgi:hypothetical protein